MKITYTLLFIFAFTIATGCHTVKPAAVNSDDAPKAIGPYSQGVNAGKLIYTAGQIGLVPATGALAGDDIGAQTQQALKNLKAVLEAAGSDMEHVVKVTVFMKNLDDFGKMNEIYKEYFPSLKPARSTVQVARLPKDALIEIECVATAK